MIKLKSKSYLTAIIIIASAFLIAFLLVMTKPKAGVITVSEQVWPVQARVIQRSTLSPSLLLYGKVESPHYSKLTASVSAKVIATYANEGDYVAAEQLLVQLDTAEYALQVKERQAAVDELTARADAERVRYQADQKSIVSNRQLLKLAEQFKSREQELLKSQAGYQAKLDEREQAYLQQELLVLQKELDLADHKNRLAQLEALIEKAEAFVAQAQNNVSDATVLAPFDGRVTKLYATKGEYVRQGDPLIDLFDLHAVEIRIQVPERYVSNVGASLANGKVLKAVATVDDQPVELYLSRLAGEVQSGRGGIDGLFRVTKGADNLIMGKTVVVNFRLEAKANVIAVPDSAIFDGDSVYQIVDNKLEKISVKIIGRLANSDNQTIIDSPELQNGDYLLTTALPNAHTGLLVKITQDD